MSVPNSIQRGFSLIEIMVAVAIIAILASIALPAYTDYVIRSRLTDAFSSLSSASASAEQFWSNNRTYVGFTGAKAWPKNTSNFTFGLAATASSFTITATGQGDVSGFVFTIDQDGNKATTSVKSGWGSPSTTCWIASKGGACLQ